MSNMKDARWFLASAAAEMEGKDFNVLVYNDEFTPYLNRAQAYLDRVPDKVVGILADLWNERY